MSRFIKCIEESKIPSIICLYLVFFCVRSLSDSSKVSFNLATNYSETPPLKPYGSVCHAEKWQNYTKAGNTWEQHGTRPRRDNQLREIESKANEQWWNSVKHVKPNHLVGRRIWKRWVKWPETIKHSIRHAGLGKLPWKLPEVVQTRYFEILVGWNRLNKDECGSCFWWQRP